MIQDTEEDWASSWLAQTYSGAPDECGPCFRAGNIVKLDRQGDCPQCGKKI